MQNLTHIRISILMRNYSIHTKIRNEIKSGWLSFFFATFCWRYKKQAMLVKNKIQYKQQKTTWQHDQKPKKLTRHLTNKRKKRWPLGRTLADTYWTSIMNKIKNGHSAELWPTSNITRNTSILTRHLLSALGNSLSSIQNAQTRPNTSLADC